MNGGRPGAGAVVALAVTLAAVAFVSMSSLRGPSDDGPDDVARPRCVTYELEGPGLGTLVAAHEVVDGELGPACLGAVEPAVAQAWETFVALVPRQDRRYLAVFAGFVEPATVEEVTLAYVNSLGGGRAHQLTVNLDEVGVDEVELRVTLAHEFAHVLTGVPSELDRAALPEDCTTFDNGEGCYLPGSLMVAWIEAFWADTIGQVDPEREPQAVDGESRCALDRAFLGPYAASSPEEDLAEAFAAFVFRIPVASQVREKILFFEQRHELRPYRDRADARGWTPADYAFEPCG